MICETKPSNVCDQPVLCSDQPVLCSDPPVLCSDPPNDDTEESGEDEIPTPINHLALLQASLIADVAVTPSLPPPPPKLHAARPPPCPSFMCRSTCRLEVSTLSRVLECLDMLDLVRFRPVCRAWRDSIDCLPYFFEPTPFPSERLWQQKGFQFVSVDPNFKFALCPLPVIELEVQGGGPQILFRSVPVVKLQIHGQWGLLSALFLTFFGKKAVRRKSRTELSAHCVVKRKGQLLPVEVSGKAVESSQVGAREAGLGPPHAGSVPTDSDWDRHEILTSDAHIILFPAEEELRETFEDPEADFFEQECFDIEDAPYQPLKIPDCALRLRRRIEVVERLNGLESVVEYLPWGLPPALPSVQSDSRALPLAAIPIDSVTIHLSPFAPPLSPTSAAETVLSRNRQHTLTALSKVLKQYLETDGFSVVARDSPGEVPSLEQSLVSLVNQVQSISSQGLEMGLECLEFSKDAGSTLLQTGSIHTSNALSTAAAGGRLLQSSLAFAVSSLQGWWTTEETKDSSSPEETTRMPLVLPEENARELTTSPTNEIF